MHNIQMLPLLCCVVSQRLSAVKVERVAWIIVLILLNLGEGFNPYVYQKLIKTQ